MWHGWASMWCACHFPSKPPPFHEHWAACGHMTQSVTSPMLAQWNQSWHGVCRLMPSYVSVSHVTGIHLSASVPERLPITYWGASCDTAKRRRVTNWNGKQGIWSLCCYSLLEIYKDICKKMSRTCCQRLHGNMRLWYTAVIGQRLIKISVKCSSKLRAVTIMHGSLEQGHFICREHSFLEVDINTYTVVARTNKVHH